MTTRSDSPCPHEHEAGAYVLGALSSEDRTAFERHLPGCPACARSVQELAGLPGLLARVPVEILDPEEEPSPVPETLLPALVRRVRREQRRRSWVAGGLVAAAAAVAIGAVGVVTWGDEETSGASSRQPTASPRPMQPVGTAPVSGSVSLTQVGWGTRVDLTCRYSSEDAEGAPAYTMYVTRTDGRTERVASWKGLPNKTLHLTAATAADADDISDVEVRLAGGPTVLELGG